jgi:hypothetical protein
VPDSVFTGTIGVIRLEPRLDSHDHLVDPNRLLDVAMLQASGKVDDGSASWPLAAMGQHRATKSALPCPSKGAELCSDLG